MCTNTYIFKLLHANICTVYFTVVTASWMASKSQNTQSVEHVCLDKHIILGCNISSPTSCTLNVRFHVNVPYQANATKRKIIYQKRYKVTYLASFFFFFSNQCNSSSLFSNHHTICCVGLSLLKMFHQNLICPCFVLLNTGFAQQS